MAAVYNSVHKTEAPILCFQPQIARGAQQRQGGVGPLLLLCDTSTRDISYLLLLSTLAAQCSTVDLLNI